MKYSRPLKIGVLAAAFFALQACSDSGTPSTAEIGLNQQKSGAKASMLGFSDDADMLAQLRQAARSESQISQNFAYPIAESGEVDASASSGSASAQTTNSGTNVQTIGVDEADLVKVSGNQLFALYKPQYGDVTTVETDTYDQWLQQNPAELKKYQLAAPAVLLDQVSLPSQVDWTGLYSLPEAEQLVLLGQGSHGYQEANYASYWWANTSVELRAVSTNPVLGELTDALWQAQFDGRLVGSRRIGNTLYLVTEYGAPYVHPSVSSDGAQDDGSISELSLRDWLPHWQLNGVDRGALVVSTDCYASAVDERRESTRITTLVALPLDNPGALSTRCMLGTAETLFVSRDALYIATTETYYGGGGFEIAIADVFPQTNSTDVHKFGFDNTLSYRGGVRLAGHLGWHQQQRSYRMGERDGVLSVVTSGGSSWTGANQDHRLFTLAEGIDGLELKAQLPNTDRPETIGKPGERIYGTRVINDKVYVVTFLSTDPLYVIDVADAEDPFIAGELEVPGFSDYLHPVSGGRLLGIGKSASSDVDGDEGRGAWYQGLRLSLFDVADPSNPSLIDALQYGDRGSSSDLFADFHALAWLDKTGDNAEFALPVNLYQHNSSPESPWQQGAFVHRGLYRFDITDSGLSERSIALLPDGYAYSFNGRSVLSSAGDAWFYDRGELYHVSAEAPTVLVPSEAGN